MERSICYGQLLFGWLHAVREPLGLASAVFAQQVSLDIALLHRYEVVEEEQDCCWAEGEFVTGSWRMLLLLPFING